MVTVVWGEWYLKAHLELNLPSLLAAENLPRFCASHDLGYIIVTRAADFETINNSHVIRAIRRLMPVEVRTLPDAETANPIAAHQRVWASATEEAKSQGTFVLFMPPDVAWSNGSFTHLAQLLSAGHRSIFMTYLRVVAETFVPAVHQHLDGSNAVLTLPAADLVDLGLRHLHPVIASHMHDSPYFPIHPEMVIWPVRDEGLIVRCLARELFLFDPNYMALSRQLLVDGPFDPQDFVFIDDSESLFAISLAPLGKDVAWHLKPAPADDMAIANWWLAYDSPINDLIAATCIRWHRGAVTSARWRRAEVASRLWIRRAASMREGQRVWRALVERRNWTAASLLAVAMRLRAFARAFRDVEWLAAIVFVPSEQAAAALIEVWQRSPPQFTDLVRSLQCHLVPADGPHAHALEDRVAVGGSLLLRSAAGTQVRVARDTMGITVADHRVLGEGLRVGHHCVYIVDGVLDPSFAPDIA